jgi:tetratricopeptide (TPR) repeat protein
VVYHLQYRKGEAEPFYQRALAIREKALGPDHLDVGRSLNNLGMLYYFQRRYAEAERLLLRALEISEKVLRPEDGEVAARLHNLAWIYREKYDLKKASSYHERAVNIWMKIQGTPIYAWPGPVLSVARKNISKGLIG